MRFIVLFLLLISPQVMAQDGITQDVLDLIPQEYIQEAIDVQAECSASPFSASHYDCKCLAVRFFDQRIKSGPDVSKDSIMMDVNRDCPNIAGRAGWMYERCSSRLSIVPPDMDPAEFCECTANAYAKMYNLVRGPPSSRASVAIQTKASAACSGGGN